MKLSDTAHEMVHGIERQRSWLEQGTLLVYDEASLLDMKDCYVYKTPKTPLPFMQWQCIICGKGGTTNGFTCGCTE